MHIGARSPFVAPNFAAACHSCPLMWRPTLPRISSRRPFTPCGHMCPIFSCSNLVNVLLPIGLPSRLHQWRIRQQGSQSGRPNDPGLERLRPESSEMPTRPRQLGFTDLPNPRSKYFTEYMRMHGLLYVVRRSSSLVTNDDTISFVFTVNALSVHSGSWKELIRTRMSHGVTIITGSRLATLYLTVQIANNGQRTQHHHRRANKVRQ